MSGFRDRLAARGDATGRAGRLHPGFLAAAVALLVGGVGLWYGASADSSGGSAGSGGAAPAGAASPTSLGTTTAFGDIVIRNAYIREPTSTRQALVSMSITNSGATPDVLLSVYCGAARSTSFRAVITNSAVQRGPSPGTYLLASGGTFALGMSGGQLVLTGLTGRLRAGDRVSMRLSFQRTGQVLIELPVLATRTRPATPTASPGS